MSPKLSDSACAVDKCSGTAYEFSLAEGSMVSLCAEHATALVLALGYASTIEPAVRDAQKIVTWHTKISKQSRQLADKMLATVLEDSGLADKIRHLPKKESK